jgi:hypothetical protein
MVFVNDGSIPGADPGPTGEPMLMIVLESGSARATPPFDKQWKSGLSRHARYSARSASTGFTWEARCAGT